MSEFPREMALADVNRHAVRRRIEASAEERALLADRLGIAAVLSLAADLTVAKRRGTIVVTGRFDAEITQACVVTLDRFDTRVVGEIDEAFTELAGDGNEQEVEIDLDTPEPLSGDALDLGEVVVQCLALEIEPHPRAPGADLAGLEAPAATTDDLSHPFAALRKLQGNC